MSASNLESKATEAFVDDDFELAAELYTRAIVEGQPPRSSTTTAPRRTSFGTDELQPNNLEVQNFKDKIKENQEKNKQMLYLVGNIVEIVHGRWEEGLTLTAGRLSKIGVRELQDQA